MARRYSLTRPPRTGRRRIRCAWRSVTVAAVGGASLAGGSCARDWWGRCPL